MGVAGIIRLLQHYAKMKELPAAAIVSVACLFVPIQMASQTWDDHDRSGRYVARDFGQNYLMSLQETGNPIIYTNGDNDTSPCGTTKKRKASVPTPVPATSATCRPTGTSTR